MSVRSLAVTGAALHLATVLYPQRCVLVLVMGPRHILWPPACTGVTAGLCRGVGSSFAFPFFHRTSAVLTLTFVASETALDIFPYGSDSCVFFLDHWFITDSRF